jgi:hypothetical protein
MEVGMNDYDIDPDVFAHYVRDAERMRAEALRELMVAAWTRLSALAAGAANLARSLRRRRKWNLSVPAPHH